MRSVITGSPRNVALIYLLAGVVWIGVSDRVAMALVTDPEALTVVQTAKGWAFIVASALLIYWLVSIGQRDLEETNEQLEQVVSKTTVFHRILRHNLRNQCTVILGHIGLLEEQVTEDPHDSLETIEAQAQQLVDMSAKSSLLRDVAVTDGSVDLETHDLAAVVDEAVSRVRELRDQPAIEVNRPSSLAVRADARLVDALVEVLENAVEHNDPSVAPVAVRAERGNGRVTVSVSDAGPGLPQIEERVLETGVETQLTHSEGLGLWIARTVVEVSGGQFTTTENDHGGTTVVMELPVSSYRGD